MGRLVLVVWIRCVCGRGPFFGRDVNGGLCVRARQGLEMADSGIGADVVGDADTGLGAG